MDWKPMLAGLLALIVLGGCAGTKRNQCVAWDWETVGYRDGVNGWQSSALLRHQETCAKHGITPDRDAYLAGWQAGIVQYCQPTNGFMVGERGGPYGNVCPAHLRDDFHAAYQDGRQLYLVKVDIANIHRAIDARSARLREVKALLAGYATGVLHEEATTADRAGMLLTVKDLALEQGQLEAEIEDLRRQAAAREADLAVLRERLAVASSAVI
jgi:hypothetical protein